MRIIVFLSQALVYPAETALSLDGLLAFQLMLIRSTMVFCEKMYLEA